jgi:hypothetical protein
LRYVIKILFYTNAFNLKHSLILLFQEVKWFSRMGIEVPNAAKEVLAQVYIHIYIFLIFQLKLTLFDVFFNLKEKKFKLYKSNLETLHSSYEKCLKLIPNHYLTLFEPHIKQTLDLCNQGCFILTWNSLNIGKETYIEIFLIF